MRLLFAVIISLFSLPAWPTLFVEGPVRMNVDFSSLSANVKSALSAANITEETVFNQMTGRLNALYNLPGQVDFLKSMTEASLAAARGSGVDYGSNIKYFIVGSSVSVGYDAGNKQFYDTTAFNDFDVKQGLPSVGLSPQLSLMAGVNLGALTNSKLDTISKDFVLYLNFSRAEYSRGGTRAVNSSWGLHSQSKVALPQRLGWQYATWGGIDLTMGLERTRTLLSYTASKAIEVGVEETSDLKYSVVADPAGTATIEMTTVTLPATISTNIRLFYFVTLFTGVGIDVNLRAEGESTLGLQSDVFLRGEVINPTAEKFDSRVGDVHIGLNEIGRGPFTDLNIFFGAQLNLLAFRLLAQLSTNISLNNIGIVAAARAGW